MKQSFLFLFPLMLISCQSSDSQNPSDKKPADTLKTKLPETRTQNIFFDTTRTYTQIEQEIDSFSKTVVNNVPPKPCGEYVLRAVTGFLHSPVNPDSLLYKYSLCEDIRKFETIHLKTLAERSPYGSWTYRFRPVGEKYYIIEGTQLVNRISEVRYYYQRKN